MEEIFFIILLEIILFRIT